MEIEGMTCHDCEVHVSQALERIGASTVRASFQRGEAVFVAPLDFSFDQARKAVAQAGYHPRGIRELTEGDGSQFTSMAGVDYDLVIIGSGSAAFAAAIEARGAGATVAMVERGTIGGTCVNVGCVPSKTLLRASEIYHAARYPGFHGLGTRAGAPDLAQLVNEKDALVQTLRQQKYEDLLAEYDIQWVPGEARFIDDRRIQVGERTITAGRYIIATGARPRIPDIPGLDEASYLTSTTALDLTMRPDRLIVIGSGYIALELGQLFRRWGAQVTLIQRGRALMPSYDADVRSVIHAAIEDAGIELISPAAYERVERHGSEVMVHLTVDKARRVVQGDALLVAAGRTPNTEALQLQYAGIDVGDHGEPLVDATLQTHNPRVYAAGDVTLGPQFVYVAAYEGKIAARNALGLAGRPQSLDLDVVPAVTFTQPGLAQVGLTETRARQMGLAVKTSVLPLAAVPRALANRDTRGIIKWVAEADSGRLRGAQVVAENAGEVIYAATLAVKHGLRVHDLTETLAPYLTMAEGLKLAALTFEQDVNKLSCCAG
ncbi:MAG: mercury(II) reductase [Sulfobacillus acidophilus]|uniref:Mercuric reductase n=1 Tax=Sulfobacillus acidophilus TaxID=53633 RepID=A0A2T2WDD5_9FIRM|nr:MAG: mercury(II) reductase [Sulfobacillus acidophilus]